ncbi:TetR/AcrR family transcriptional regulator [Microbacterium sp.]|uniref:TetR/AcrR family transcriptional regulator n=1 Tax=Microbacterium sp. TaxID=51671 RepID=UPI0039E5731E
MSRPPLAREKVLDAFESLLCDGGARAATMDATARAAGVSKGGLLYHFASKDALESALVERMVAIARADLEAMRAEPAGVVASFIRGSIMTGTPLDRAIVAVAKLAQGGSSIASDSLHRVRDLWEETLRPHVRDETALQLVMLVSDGLYFNNALAIGTVPGPDLTREALDALIALVEASVR